MLKYRSNGTVFMQNYVYWDPFIDTQNKIYIGLGGFRF